MTLGLRSVTYGPMRFPGATRNLPENRRGVWHREGTIDVIQEFRRLNIELELFSARRRADE